MIGNDIIDLQQSKIESNPHRKGWLNKLFSEKEIESITHNKNAETTIWLYWSMKEAAYKIYNRMSGIINFAPSKFSCTMTALHNDKANGYVLFNDMLYHTQSSINKDYIHTVALIKPHQSVQILMNNNTTALELPKDFSLHKDNNDLPYLLNDVTNTTIIASKSHHGRFLALVY